MSAYSISEISLEELGMMTHTCNLSTQEDHELEASLSYVVRTCLQIITTKNIWVWWHMPVIPALERLRQEDHEEDHWLHSETLSQKKVNLF
jgi:Mg/Co/Ni transporter MgtE